jgi:putative ATP-dependent endonuclease of OLD family
LTIDDFPESKVDEANLPEVELYTKVSSKPPGNKWIATIDGEEIVRERWTFSAVGVEGKRQGFDVLTNDWSEQKPWGWTNVANARRPKPHRIEAFATPENSTQQVVKILLTSLQNTVKALPLTEINEAGEDVPTNYAKLLDGLNDVRESVVVQVQEQIDLVQEQLTSLIQNVFRGYKVTFEAKQEEDLATCLTFFKPGAVLRMGPANGHLSAAQHQGSGARRTLMWAALKYAREHEGGDVQQNLLLMDEPELCLHPNAIREACNTLYDLPAGGKWQVMVTTHSPAFIDLSRDNTTVVRVERDADGKVIRGTTVFRPSKAKLNDDEKVELKMLNLCDPSLCEFFFGGRTIIVEGDTEYTAFKYILDKYPDDALLRDVHIVRARGKATICLVAKILNQFDARYAILHDSDSPKCVAQKRNGTIYQIDNPAWTVNSQICAAVENALEAGRARLVAMIPNFEVAFFGKEVSSEKPINAWKKLKGSPELCEKIRSLLHCLLDFDKPVPAECEEWSETQQLLTRWEAMATAN